MSFFKKRFVTTKTDDAVLTLAEMGEIIVNKGSAVVIGLPNPATASGMWYNLVNIGAGLVSVEYDSAPLELNGLVVELSQYETCFIFSNGTDWIGMDHTYRTFWDDGGAHGFEIDMTPPDSDAYLKWDFSLQKFVYDNP